MTPAAPGAALGAVLAEGGSLLRMAIPTTSPTPAMSTMRRLMVTAFAALSVCAVASCANPSPPSATAGFGPTGAVAIGIGFPVGR
jgi:hypothetical protein